MGHVTGRTYRVQVVDALSHEIRIKIGVPKRSVIGPFLFLLYVNDIRSVINVLTPFFADDVKMVSPRSQSGILQNYVIWGFPINPTKCNYFAIRQAPPVQLSFATGSPGHQRC